MSIETITQEEFEIYIKDGDTLILFLADWCPLCAEVFTIFQTLSEESYLAYPNHPVKIAVADFDMHNMTNHRYGIYGTPTVAAFSDGELLDTWPGLRPESDYREILSLLCQYRK
jgi:thioredoxin-like negative regulator of GroEL